MQYLICLFPFLFKKRRKCPRLWITPLSSLWADSEIFNRWCAHYLYKVSSLSFWIWSIQEKGVLFSYSWTCFSSGFIHFWFCCSVLRDCGLYVGYLCTYLETFCVYVALIFVNAWWEGVWKSINSFIVQHLKCSLAEAFVVFFKSSAWHCCQVCHSKFKSTANSVFLSLSSYFSAFSVLSFIRKHASPGHSYLR